MKPGLVGWVVLALLPAPRAHAQAPQPQPQLRRIAPLRSGVSAGPESRDGRYLLTFAEGKGGVPRQLGLLDLASGRSSALGDADADYEWSPDARQLAFARQDEGSQELFVWTLPIDPEAGRQAGPARRISVRSGRMPAFSPDGRSIAFSALPATDSAGVRIVVVPATGGAERVVLRARGYVRNLEWSADGRWLYFQHGHGASAGRRRTVSRVPAAGGEEQVLQEAIDFHGLSPDGRFIAYTIDGTPAGTTLGFATADGLEVARYRAPRRYSIGRWAGSGLRLNVTETDEASALRLVSPATGAIRTLSLEGAHDREASWSPDGRMLALMEVAGERNELAVMPPSGSPRTLLPTDGDVDGPGLWSPDGSHLAYTTGARSAVWVTEVATGIRARLAEGRQLRVLGWSSGGEAVLALQRDGGLSIRRITLGGVASDLLRRPASDGPVSGVSVAGDTMALLTVPGAVLRADFRSGRTDTLYTAPAPERIDDQSAVEASKEGRWAAVPVIRPTVGGPNAIHVVPLGGGTARRVPFGPLAWVVPFTWHPDGRHLLTLGTADNGAAIRLQMLSLDDGRLRVLSGPETNEVWNFAISPDGGTVAFVASTSISATYWSLDFARVLAVASQEGR